MLTSLYAKIGDLKPLQSKNIEGGVKTSRPGSTTLKKVSINRVKMNQTDKKYLF